jgi:hypothetical protein
VAGSSSPARVEKAEIKGLGHRRRAVGDAEFFEDRRHVKAGGSLCDAQPPSDGAHTIFLEMSDCDRWAGREPWRTEPDRTGQRGVHGYRRAAAVGFGKTEVSAE